MHEGLSEEGFEQFDLRQRVAPTNLRVEEDQLVVLPGSLDVLTDALVGEPIKPGAVPASCLPGPRL